MPTPSYLKITKRLLNAKSKDSTLALEALRAGLEILRPRALLCLASAKHAHLQGP